MIFVTLGTHEQPFPRALALLDALPRGAEVVVQHGHTAARTELADVEWREYVTYEEMLELAARATDVVCHAGVGTIMTVLGCGKTPIVVPRLRELGEHVDDHQLQITQEFAKAGLVVPCLPDTDLEAALRDARGRRTTFAQGGRLKEVIAAAVDGKPLPAATVPRCAD